ncbi:MAG: Ppx/GppA phosphatase family protein [Pseudomonadota bacterium]
MATDTALSVWPRRAVIDIGSNSVRLVIFTGPPRVPIPVVNEKSLCGLGDRDPDTGNLRPSAMTEALATLRRFSAVLALEEPETVDVFATAAVRDAPNGPEFLHDIKVLGFAPRLLTGVEEARLAGLGILCSAPEIVRDRLEAIGGDLGGGSLELSRLGAGPDNISDMVSLPIGSLRLTKDYGDDRAAAIAFVDEHLAPLSWLRELSAPHLYVVGGAWRAIARVGMNLAKHPVPILDHYRMSAEHVRATCAFVENEEPETLARIDRVQKKRVPTLPMASIVLRKLLDVSNAQSVVVSACGVREGFLFEKLKEETRAEEPLFALAQDIAERHRAYQAGLAEGAAAFTDELFDETPALRRLRHAASMMIRMASTSHPDQRAEHAASVIMAAPFVGIDHIERTMLAVMMKSRFGGSVGKSGTLLPIALLEKSELDHATAVGRALRLAATLKVPLYRSESGFRLYRSDGRLVLQADDSVRDLLTEHVTKDLDRLAQAMSLPAEIRLP